MYGIVGQQFTWNGFVKFWTGWLSSSNAVLPITMGVMVLALFIITRGKWRT